MNRKYGAYPPTTKPKAKLATSGYRAQGGTFVESTPEDPSKDIKHEVTRPRVKIEFPSGYTGKAPEGLTPLIGEKHPKIYGRMPIPLAIGKAFTELEHCRRSLGYAIKHCLDLDFSFVSCAISCILTSLRPLHIEEINTAVDLFVDYAESLSPSRSDEGPSSRQAWLQKCRSFLVIDDRGLVRFASDLMPQFLERFHIRGIDATHQTIATACLIQVELDESSETSSLAGLAGSVLPDSGLAFSDYAATHWRVHCRRAEESCQRSRAASAPARVSCRKLTDRHRDTTCAKEAEIDLDLIGLESLAISDEESDWDMLEEYG